MCKKLLDIYEKKLDEWYDLRNFMISTMLTMQATPIKAPITTPMNITAHIVHNKQTSLLINATISVFLKRLGGTYDGRGPWQAPGAYFTRTPSPYRCHMGCLATPYVHDVRAPADSVALQLKCFIVSNPYC